MRGRGRHQSKEVAEVVAYAESLGWTRIAGGGGHVWATLRCPTARRDGCQARVASTPQNAGSHARRLRRAIDACPHQPEGTT